MNERQLLSPRQLSQADGKSGRTTFHGVSRVEALARERRDFQIHQEAKIQATARQDAIDAKAVPHGALALIEN
jgi:hypothetical protein